MAITEIDLSETKKFYGVLTEKQVLGIIRDWFIDHKGIELAEYEAEFKGLYEGSSAEVTITHEEEIDP